MVTHFIIASDRCQSDLSGVVEASSRWLKSQGFESYRVLLKTTETEGLFNCDSHTTEDKISSISLSSKSAVTVFYFSRDLNRLINRPEFRLAHFTSARAAINLDSLVSNRYPRFLAIQGELIESPEQMEQIANSGLAIQFSAKTSPAFKWMFDFAWKVRISSLALFFAKRLRVAMRLESRVFAPIRALSRLVFEQSGGIPWVLGREWLRSALNPQEALVLGSGALRIPVRDVCWLSSLDFRETDS